MANPGGSAEWAEWEGDAVLSSAREHLGTACYRATKQPSVVLLTDQMQRQTQPLGEHGDGVQRLRAQLSLERLLFFSPGHTCGCQAVDESKADNGYLMAGLMHIRPEYALFVPSGLPLSSL